MSDAMCGNSEKMDEIDNDSYSKALKLFHDVPTWRKIFVCHA